MNRNPLIFTRRRAGAIMPVCRRGVAALEFAVIGVIMLALLVPTVGLSLYLYQASILQGALAQASLTAQSFPDNYALICTQIDRYVSNNYGLFSAVTILTNPPNVTSTITMESPACAAGNSTLQDALASSTKCNVICNATPQFNASASMSITIATPFVANAFWPSYLSPVNTLKQTNVIVLH